MRDGWGTYVVEDVVLGALLLLWGGGAHGACREVSLSEMSEAGSCAECDGLSGCE